MIYDRLENFAQYRKLAPEVWDAVLEFCRRCGAAAPEAGRYELGVAGVYASVQSYAPHPLLADKLEYHRNYADVQLLLAGAEAIYCGDPAQSAECVPYDPVKDVGFNAMPHQVNVLPLEVGNFALLLPGEGHQPQVGDPESAVVKVVVKIPSSALK